MNEQQLDQNNLPKGYSESESDFRGYVEGRKNPLEIISPNKAKEIINENLNDTLPKSDLSEFKKRRIQDIVYTCLGKLDQNQILSGHIRGITQGFIPALLEERDCVKSFFDPNAFLKGFDHDPSGISVNDFIFQSLTRKCKPSNFSRLVYRSKKMPAIDSQKILQNRRDGILLGKEVHFNALREMIHDQKNAGLPTVLAMIKFYETKDSSDLVTEIKKWNSQYPEDDMSPLLERHLYERTFFESKQDQSLLKIRTIDVLYRLQENLSFIGFEPPSTPDPILNEALEDTSANFGHPSLDSINTYEEPLRILNEILISAIQKGQIGIDPSYIATTNWLRERIGTIMAGLPFEAIETLYTEASLEETLRLMELTAHSSSYNEKDFRTFVSLYQSQKSFQKAHEQIYKRSITRQSHTAKYFRDNVSCEYKFGGNLTSSELILTNENIEKQLQSLNYLNNHKPITHKGRDRYHEALGMYDSH